ncbi:cell wall metabolism sensor histidine kinase WalK [Cryobacterium sp. M91]|uniref:sensor histidine kinase n=1 Tax=Cryobacterium sp. M91 TaxID=2048294 RepID=UPI000CE30AC9|nr:HAMP domain-containing sensor histidine kinase [Cryobacterium sp. M91]
MRTTSLRLRVVAAVLAMLTIVLVTVGILINVVLGGQLRADLQQRLIDRAGYAQILAEEGLAAQSLANRLTGDDVTVTYSVGGDTVYGRTDPTPRGDRGPGAPPHAETVPGAVVTQSGDRLSVTQTVAGGTLTLSSSEAGIDAALAQLRTIEVVAGALTIVVTGLLLSGVVGVALRPLTRMTELALAITQGGRGGRLRPSNPRTEIGRTAGAFDDMLQALETAENTSRQAAADAQAAEITARDAAQVAAAAEERMRRLLADVSHELRTPVAGLQASAETLLRDNPARAERESLTVGMIQQTQRAARLVDDLLLMTRLDQGDEGAAFEPIDLSALTRDVVAEQRMLGASREFDLAVAAEVWVSGDAQRLTQIVTNLLGNARTATEPGGSIRTSLAIVDGTARLEVNDSGAGVPAPDRERIFERFVRLDPSRASNRGGSGLGLSIARALARAHGGTLECLEPVATGARFALTLPLARA